jgi:hypothetical protein
MIGKQVSKHEDSRRRLRRCPVPSSSDHPELGGDTSTYVAVVLLTDGVDVAGILEAERAIAGLPSAIATIVGGQCTRDDEASVMSANLLAQMTGWPPGPEAKSEHLI